MKKNVFVIWNVKGFFLWNLPGLWKHEIPPSRTVDMHLQVETRQLSSSLSISVRFISADERLVSRLSSSFFHFASCWAKSLRVPSSQAELSEAGSFGKKSWTSFRSSFKAHSPYPASSPSWGGLWSRRSKICWLVRSRSSSSTSRRLRPPPAGTLLRIANLESSPKP